MNRRNFFQKTALAGIAAVSFPEIIHAAMPEANFLVKKSFRKGEVILLQGDSITDCGRSRDSQNIANNQSQIGSGYTLFTAANILANQADKELKIYNRGISGNKVYQLAERWDEDCLSLKPDYLSILIGVNDFWHTKSHDYKGTAETYEKDYTNLIERTKKALPDIKIIICEPFIIHGGKALDDTWEPAFAPYRKAAKRIAKKFDLSFVPFQSIFIEALKKAPVTYWGEDGVHPSMAGAQLMAQALLNVLR
jgi:Lysophospholipase L1 and related esterases